ncbi:MAG: hypothetical protein LWX83_02120, partial [Anaerolineae bacterium]|nr:hypothetical protein [Anaerolineae bacterium]
MKKVLIIVIFFILLVAFFSTLPFFRSATNDQSLTDLQQKGVIRIGYAVEAPYAYVLENGKISGESPEVAKVIV